MNMKKKNLLINKKSLKLHKVVTKFVFIKIFPGCEIFLRIPIQKLNKYLNHNRKIRFPLLKSIKKN